MSACAKMNKCKEQVKEREQEERRKCHRKSSKKNTYIFALSTNKYLAVCRYFAAALLGATLDPIYSAIILVLSLRLACALLLCCTPTTQLLFFSPYLPICWMNCVLYGEWRRVCRIFIDQYYLHVRWADMALTLCTLPVFAWARAHTRRDRERKRDRESARKISMTKYGNEKQRSPMWAFVPGIYVLLWDHVRRQKKAASNISRIFFFSLSCCFTNTKFYCYCENGCRGCRGYRYRTEWYHVRW